MGVDRFWFFGRLGGELDDETMYRASVDLYMRLLALGKSSSYDNDFASLRSIRINP